MSRIVSISPSTATLVTGQSVDLVIEVADVPPDATAEVLFEASDGTTGSVTITLDAPELEALLGPGPTPAAHQIRSTVDTGLLAVVSADADTVTLRYTAP